MRRKACYPWVALAFATAIGGCDGDSNGTDHSGGPSASEDAGARTDGDDTDAETWVSPVEEDSFTAVERDQIGVVPFDQDTMLDYHIYMDPAAYEDMTLHGDDEEYRRVSLQVRGPDVEEDYTEVGVRYKGDYSVHHCWDSGSRSFTGECAKLSIRIKFNEYDRDGRFFGLKKVNLNAMSYDVSKLRERLAYSVFNEFGVETVRTAHARLFINDMDPVLVLAVEQVDGRYTAYRFPDGGDGNVLKEMWPRPGRSEEEVLEQLKTNDDVEDEPDVSRFIAFGDAVGAATESTFLNDMADFVEVEQLLRYMAVDRAFKNWDGFTAFYWEDRSHNFYWYHDVETTGLFSLIPWDLDQVVWMLDPSDPYLDPGTPYAERQVPNWNVRPASCDPILVWDEYDLYPSGCDPLINLLAATSWDEFAVLGAELLDTSFSYDDMNAKLTRWAEQIAPAVETDPLISTGAWESAVDQLREILEQAIDDFEAHLSEGYVVEE